eukprot:scaffold64078_cov16-Tisochrysis_lutea.AAC.1
MAAKSGLRKLPGLASGLAEDTGRSCTAALGNTSRIFLLGFAHAGIVEYGNNDLEDEEEEGEANEASAVKGGNVNEERLFSSQALITLGHAQDWPCMRAHAGKQSLGIASSMSSAIEGMLKQIIEKRKEAEAQKQAAMINETGWWGSSLP